MTITTISHLPPMIHQHFNKYLLFCPWEWCSEEIPKCREKIMRRNGGKGQAVRDFQAVVKLFEEAYERKKKKAENKSTKGTDTQERSPEPFSACFVTDRKLQMSIRSFCDFAMFDELKRNNAI